MRPYHPDDRDMLWRDPRRPQGNGGGGNGGGPGPGLLSPFLPGNKGLLAQQLSAGFGGQPAQYRQHFNRMYQPMPTGFFQPGKGFGGPGGGNGGGNGSGGGNGVDWGTWMQENGIQQGATLTPEQLAMISARLASQGGR